MAKNVMVEREEPIRSLGDRKVLMISAMKPEITLVSPPIGYIEPEKLSKRQRAEQEKKQRSEERREYERLHKSKE